MKQYLLVFFLFFCSLVSNAQEGPLLSVKDFFSALNLDYPGLEQVKADVAADNYKSATADFVSYLKNRDNFKWTFDWKDKTSLKNPSYDTSKADKYASNLLPSCGIWHQFEDPIVDWSVNPTELKYKEWTWQLNRHPFWRELGRAYCATGNEKYAVAFVKQIRSWILTNPRPEKADNRAGSRWRTIEAGIRTLDNWPDAFLYFLGSPSFDDETVLLMMRSFYEHGEYLREFHRNANNWLTMEMNGLFHIAILFPEFKKSQEWAKYASDKLYEQEKLQFYPDGAQVELAPGYHGVSLSNVMDIYQLARLNDYPLNPDYAARLEAAYHYYLAISTPDYTVPAVNDSFWKDVKVDLKRGKSYFPGREDFTFVSSSGKKGSEPSFKSVWMPWAGWYIMRSSWNFADAFYTHFDVGPLSSAHSHEDKLTFIMYAYGKRLVTECGIYAYDSSKWRKYCLTAPGHNVTRVDGMDQNRAPIKKRPGVGLNVKPQTNRWISNAVFEFAEGWYDEGFGPDRDTTVTQYRAIAYLKEKCWIVFDLFTPSDDKVHSYDSWFHFNTDNYRELPGLGAVMTADEKGANMAVVPMNPSSGTMKVICGQEAPEVQGWVNKRPTNDYKCDPVATPVFHREKAGQFLDAYLFYPVREGGDCPVKAVRTGAKGSYEIMYRDGKKDKVSIVLEGNSIKTLTINGTSL